MNSFFKTTATLPFVRQRSRGAAFWKQFLGGRAPVNRVQEGTARRERGEEWEGTSRDFQQLLGARHGGEQTCVSRHSEKPCTNHLFKETNSKDLHFFFMLPEYHSGYFE